jgi:sugar-specific transcriptional regulator TrmB
MQNLNHSFDILGLKPATRRVLITLTEKGTSTAADIASFLNLPKSSVYDSLSELIDKSLVVEYSNDRSKTFAIPDKEQLARVHKKEVAELESAHATLVSFLQNHTSESHVAKPKIKFYAGVEGIKQAFRDMPWTKEYKEAYLMWPTTDMIDLLGEEFLFAHRKPGLELGVVVNVIEEWKDRKLDKGKYKWLTNNPQNLNKKRYAKKGTDWQMSYWIYGNKCLFASGGREKFAFMIQSKEFAELMKVMWKEMWEGCKE